MLHPLRRWYDGYALPSHKVLYKLSFFCLLIKSKKYKMKIYRYIERRVYNNNREQHKGNGRKSKSKNIETVEI